MQENIQDLLYKRVRVNTGNIIIEGLLGYFGKPKYADSVKLAPRWIQELLDQEDQGHLFDLKFFYKDGREMASDNKGVGYYVFRYSDIKSPIELAE